jgi:SAM-dependent methyltransferase
MLGGWIRTLVRGLVPATGRRLSKSQERRLGWPSVGFVRFGDLRRHEPISRVFGLDRGRREHCIDIYMIERFLARHEADIHGRVLEFGDDEYSRKFGNGRVIKSDVLSINADNPSATIVADLTEADQIPSDTFDCIICTQTIQFIYDVRSALNTLYRILRPGGVLLATFTGISQISRYDMDRWGDYWRLTTKSANRMFTEFWPSDCVEVRSHGNVLLAVAYLHGLTIDEVGVEDLDHDDPDYQLVITVRAVRPTGT